MSRGLIYVIGSLRNPNVPNVANRLREQGWDVFDDWFASGPEADDKWREYEIGRGHDYPTALRGRHANEVFDFDKKHLDMAQYAVLVMPAGKSGFLELGYAIGKGKPSFILLDNKPDRFDVMFKFATDVLPNVEELMKVFL